MRQAVGAGALYFALVFALGFVLGTVRTLVLEPQIGLEQATLVELPAMLIASWIACGWVIRQLAVPPRARFRLLMGTVALVLLLLGEVVVSMLLRGRSLAEHLATYGEPARQWGLAAQIAFAAFPVLRRQAAASASSA